MYRLLIILPTIVLSTALPARTIIVGTNQPVTSIRKAIELAKNKDTVVVQQGIYREGNILINKNIILLGQDFPVIDGEQKFEIFTVSGISIVIRGFQFQNCGSSAMNDYASIKIIDSKNISIEGNKVINSYFGIHVSNCSFITIKNNIISGSPKK